MIIPTIKRIFGNILLPAKFSIDANLTKNKLGNMNEIEFAAIDPTIPNI
jgi:hypothetical protein